MSAHLETPPLLTVAARYADNHAAELRRHVRAGGVVRVLDTRAGEVIEYRSQERPACLVWMPDDTAALSAMVSERRLRSLAQRGQHD